MTALPRPHRFAAASAARRERGVAARRRRALAFGRAAGLAGALLPAVAFAAPALEQPLATLLDEGYEVIAVTDAGDRSFDLVYLKKGKSHVVCRFVPFSPDWTPLGESTCLPMNYATE
ncbi:MAG: hypothetical protein R3D02_04180 [Hyphomicrobiales bacterium]